MGCELSCVLYLRYGFADVNLVPSYLFCFAYSAKMVVVFDQIVEELIFYLASFI